MPDPEVPAEETPNPELPGPELVQEAAPAVEVIDRPQVEVVIPPEQSAPHPVPVEHSALERAAEAAMAMPGLPGRDEFLMLAVQARILSMSAGAPKAVRNNPHLAFHVAMVGRDLGISPSAALELIDVIGEGDKTRLSLSPQLLNGQIRRLGLGSIVPAVRANDRCVAMALEPGGKIDPRCRATLPDVHHDECGCVGVLGGTEFTWEEARQAGLAGRDCKAWNDHSADCKANKRDSQKCAQGWRTYPRRMLWWRAGGYCADDFFPEAGLGLYTAEELGSVVDEEGRPIDPANVELPDGYAPPEKQPSILDDVVADATDETDPDLVQERQALQGQIDALRVVPDAVAALKVLWEQQDDEGRRKTPPWLHERFQRRHLVRARAIVKSVEDRVKRGEFGADAKTAWVDATTTDAGFGAGKDPKPDPESSTATVPVELSEEAKATLATYQQQVIGAAAEMDKATLRAELKAMEQSTMGDTEMMRARYVDVMVRLAAADMRAAAQPAVADEAPAVEDAGDADDAGTLPLG